MDSGRGPKRILFLTASGHLGGAEILTLRIMEELRRSHPEVSLGVVVPECGPLADCTREIGVTTALLPFPEDVMRLGDAGLAGSSARAVGGLVARMAAASPAIARYLLQLKRAVRGFSPDVLHTTSLKMHVLGAWSKTPSAALVWHIQDYVGSRRVMRRLMRWSSHRCRTAVACSDSVAEDFSRCAGPPTRTLRIYNMVDTARLAPGGPAMDLDAAGGVPPVSGALRVGLVGTFARWKGHPVFLKALSLLPRSLPVRGYIVGDAVDRTDGSQFSREELQRMAADLGVADRVVFTGFVRDVAQAMRSLDVVVHASTYPEPFGLVIAEGMACGKAVIVAGAGGAAEIVRDGVDALAHTPGDAACLAARIRELAESPSLRCRIAAEARRAATQFDISHLDRLLFPVYQEALQGRP